MRMFRQSKRFQMLRGDRLFLCLLAVAYIVYLATGGGGLLGLITNRAGAVSEHPVTVAAEVVQKYWTRESMQGARDVDGLVRTGSDFALQNNETVAANGAKQKGNPPLSGESSYPLSTVGKVFFTDSSGLNYVCSGTAVKSLNKSVVDTAGHCLYWNSGWMRNVLFCPLYDNGNTPYGCWAARDLLVPDDWMNPRANDYHHDMGMAIVADNEQGHLTDLVGGAGWAYNQSVNQPFYAYGYPAARPFNGQTRQSCAEGSIGKSWRHGAGTVISIPCNMTGGSSGGPWFIKNGGNWYLNGHNDFTSSMQYGHMFSPYYDDTWYAMYDKAQHS